MRPLPSIDDADRPLVDHQPEGRECLGLRYCPLPDCQADLTGPCKTSQHFYEEHSPEDFGLTPLGEIRADHASPTFTESDRPGSPPTARSTESEPILAADGGRLRGDRA